MWINLTYKWILLIEPKGIEIKDEWMCLLFRPPINRTKRNWNNHTTSISSFTVTINRTKRNWNLLLQKGVPYDDRLLIEPKGIEIEKQYWVFPCLLKLLIEPKGIEIQHQPSPSHLSILLIEPKGIEIFNAWCQHSLQC